MVDEVPGRPLSAFSFFWKTVILWGILSISAGCGFGETEKNIVNSNVISRTPVPEYDQIMSSLKTADFDYIFTVKRKDAMALTTEDRQFLNAKTYRANRRRVTKDEKILLIGSNYEIADKDLDAIKKKFEFEDFSKPENARKKEDNAKTGGKKTGKPATNDK